MMGFISDMFWAFVDILLNIALGAVIVLGILAVYWVVVTVITWLYYELYLPLSRWVWSLFHH